MRTVAILVLAFSTACTAAGSPRVASDDVVLFADGARVHGDVRARVIHVPADAVVWVERSATLHARELLRVDGTLRAVDVGADDAVRDAPTLVLRSDRFLVVTGTVRGGRGKSLANDREHEHVLERGGDGSDVWAAAPTFELTGTIHGGHGGAGGPGAGGGAGGSLWLAEDVASVYDWTEPLPTPTDGPSSIGGNGGPPGRALSADEYDRFLARGVAADGSGGASGGGVEWMQLEDWLRAASARR